VVSLELLTLRVDDMDTMNLIYGNRGSDSAVIGSPDN
jgi:hypothetical protein